jgi:uncharacterized OB-fold protein
MSPWNKPVPEIDADIKPFFDGLREHRFLLFRCTTCGAWYWPAAYCRFHPNKPYMQEMEWTEASGRGTVATFNIMYTAFHPGFRDEVPFAFAMVQLDEGPMTGSTIVDCRPEEVYVGMPVEVVYDDVEELELTLPRFRPLKPEAAAS